jgi:hypothetical protein
MGNRVCSSSTARSRASSFGSRGRARSGPLRCGGESRRARAADALSSGGSPRKRPDVRAETKVRCEVGPRPDPMSLWARGKRPVKDGAVVFIQASGGTELRCKHAVARQLAPGTRQKRCNRVSTRSLAHMAPPVDHFQVRRGAQLLVPMLDDAVLQPGLSRRQAEEHIVVYSELGADPAAAGRGRNPVAPAL